MCWHSHKGVKELRVRWMDGRETADSKGGGAQCPKRALEKKGRYSQIYRCGMVLRASVSCRGLQMALRIKWKLCWLPRNRLWDTLGATWEGLRLAQGEEAEGKGCSHRVKIAFIWVFEISKNKLPLKKKNSMDSWYARWMRASLKVTPPFFFVAVFSVTYFLYLSHILSSCTEALSCPKLWIETELNCFHLFG